MKTRELLTRKPSRALIIIAFSISSASVQAIDWGSVKGKEVTLFYPGQASWEWLLTESDHSAADKFKQGKNCIECHKLEESDIGTKIVTGKKLEPDPIPGKSGSIKVNIKTAHDSEKFYVRFEWNETPQGDQPKMDKDFDTKITVMFDDGHVVEAKRAGCWGTCHDDAEGMASAPPGKEITKYLARSRTKFGRSGGGENYKSQAELDQLLNEGVFMEFWQAGLNQGAEPVAVDGYILDKRHKNDNPLVDVQAEFNGGTWTVTMSRKLAVSDPHRKNITPGQTYPVGFAMHDNHTNHRYHYVSFEHTFALDQGEADFIAVKK
jgi:hypothetical protein